MFYIPNKHAPFYDNGNAHIHKSPGFTGQEENVKKGGRERGRWRGIEKRKTTWNQTRIHSILYTSKRCEEIKLSAFNSITPSFMSRAPE